MGKDGIAQLEGNVKGQGCMQEISVYDIARVYEGKQPGGLRRDGNGGSA